MRTDPAQHMLEIDLTSALQNFHDGRVYGRSLDAQEWARYFELASQLGYEVTTHCEWDRPPVALVLARNSNGNKDLEAQWTLARQTYKEYRARIHNNPHPLYIERWSPSPGDSEVMKQLGVTWTSPIPQSEKEEVPGYPEF